MWMQLPLRFEPHLSNPCWRVHSSGKDPNPNLNPNPNASERQLLRCLPAFFLAGGMQCGVGDLARRLKAHRFIQSGRDVAPHWWTNHPKSRAGGFARYVSLFSSDESTSLISSQPQTLLGDSSPASFAFIMAEQLRLHYRYLDAFSKCHSDCRNGKARPERLVQCRNRSYPLSHCYGEAEKATTPLDFNLPAFMSTVYATRPPLVIVMLRDPTIRLWIAFNSYGQYPVRSFTLQAI